MVVMDTCASNHEKHFAHSAPFAFLLGLLFLLVSLFGMLILPVSAGSEEINTEVQYYFFRDSSALATSGNTLFIADLNAIYAHRFDPIQNRHTLTHQFNTLGTVRDMVVHGRMLFTVENIFDASGDSIGTLMAYEIDPAGFVAPGTALIPVFGTAYTTGYYAIAVFNNYIYAVRNRELVVFNLVDFTYSRTITMQEPFLIEGIVASDNFLFVAQRIDGNLIIHRLNTAENWVDSLSLGGESLQRMVWIQNEAQLAVWTNRSLIFVNHDFRGFIAFGTLSGRGIDHLATGRDRSGADRFFVFDDHQKITSLSIDLSDEQVLIASRSHLNGFFNSPLDVTTINRRILTADSRNNRVSIQYGSNFSFIEGLNAPFSITACREGILSVAHMHNLQRNQIAQFYLEEDGTTRHKRSILFSPTVSPSYPIAKLQTCSDGNLFVLAQSGVLYRMIATSTSPYVAFTQVAETSSVQIVSLSVGLSRPLFYAASVTSGNEVVLSRKTTSGLTLLNGIPSIPLARFIDFAADSDGAIYILQRPASGISAFEIVRYDYQSDGTYAQNPFIFSLPHYKSGAALIRIHLSSIDNETLVGALSSRLVNYRDLLIVDYGRHTVSRISAFDEFQLAPQNNNPPTISGSLNPPHTSAERIIYTITAHSGAPMFATPSSAFPLMRQRLSPGTADVITQQVVLPYDFRIIVPFGINPHRNYSRVIADNLRYNAGSNANEILIGYVRNSHISPEALPYIDEPGGQEYAFAYYQEGISNGIPIFALPSLQAPIFYGFETVPRSVPLRLLPFTYWIRRVPVNGNGVNGNNGLQNGNYIDELLFGYFDNRDDGRKNNAHRWFRIQFECEHGNTHQGFVRHDSISIGLASPSENYPTLNATIISKNPHDHNEPAVVFAICNDGYMLFDNYGNPVAHAYHDSLAVGRRVEVLSNFDFSETYTRIQFMTDFGVVVAYVYTLNIEYDGISMIQVIALSLAIILIAFTSFIVFRYHQVKPRHIPKKEPDETFV
ncbi:MAG: hypothetical protein FWC82_02570 [Firmicutes bacterium]|nr:hypothetical protein [Bacillota bacterium]